MRGRAGTRPLVLAGSGLALIALVATGVNLIRDRAERRDDPAADARQKLREIDRQLDSLARGQH